MVLGLFGGTDVGDLIAKKKYARAIEVLGEQLRRGSSDPRVRNQLADVLIMAGREKEAVPVLIELADEYARDNQAPRAIALLKKIERIDPGRRDVDQKLASLIRDKKPRPKAPAGGGWQPYEEGGLSTGGSVFDASHFEPSPYTGQESVAAAKKASWEPDIGKKQEEAPAAPDFPAIQLPPEPDEPPMFSQEMFRGQVLDVIQQVLQAPAAPTPAPAAAAPAATEGEEPMVEVEPEPELVTSPLFGDMSEDELIAFMRGLRLLSFEPGDVILTEGHPGDSLFVVSSGLVKAFVKDQGATGQRLARTMKDGDFFGEISILSGKPRTATVTAATRVELLEMDRPTLDEMLEQHPRILQVLQDFYIARASA
jgi:hypothetical protein